MANTHVTIACMLMLAASADAFWPWWSYYGGGYNGAFDGGYGLKKGGYGLNSFYGSPGFGGLGGSPLLSSRSSTTRDCNFCSKVNSPACCSAGGKCCKNEISKCPDNLQCNFRQNCTVSGYATDYCPLFGCCRLNTVECCPQPAAVFPYDALWVATGEEATAVPRSYFKFGYPFWKPFSQVGAVPGKVPAPVPCENCEEKPVTL